MDLPDECLYDYADDFEEYASDEVGIGHGYFLIPIILFHNVLMSQGGT